MDHQIYVLETYEDHPSQFAVSPYTKMLPEEFADARENIICSRVQTD